MKLSKGIFRCGLSLILAFSFVIFALPAAYPITIDGTFDDWSGISALGTDPSGDVLPADPVDWTTLWATSQNNTLYLSYQTSSSIDFTNHAWRYNIFVDTDNNPATGYKGLDNSYKTGADYLIQGAGLFQYTGNGTSWAWSSGTFYPYGITNNRLEIAIPESELGLTAGYHIKLLFDGDNPSTPDYAKDDKDGFLFPDPLSGYWRLNENQGTQVLDSSSSNNNGTITGAAWSRYGFSGSCLSFDGTDDYAQIPNSLSLNPQSAITLEAWVKIPQYPQAAADIITKYNGGVVGSYLLTVLFDGTIGFSVESPWSSIISTGSISLNSWHHIVATFDGTNKCIYIDGQLDSQNTGGGLWSHPTPVLIGARLDNGSPAYHFRGLIDEVKIYNRALSADEIRGAYNSSVLAASWQMNENQGSVIHDSSSSCNNGVAYNASWSQGINSSSLSFNGVNSYVDLQTGSSLSGTIDFTIEAWIKTQATARGVIIQQRDLANYNGEYQLVVLSDGKLSFWSYGDNEYGFNITSIDTVNDNKWHHISAQRRQGEGLLYIDGLLDSSQTAPARNLDSTIKTVIGRDIRDNGSTFNGLIDELRIYKRALSPQEISYDYKPLALSLSFEEPSGTQVLDSSLNSNNGALYGGTARVDAVSAKGLSFDGIDDYAQIPDNVSLNPQSALTLEAWVKLSQYPQVSYDIITKYNQGVVGSYLLTVLCDGKILFSIESPWSYIISTNSLSLNQWHHIITTFDGTNKSIYIDGLLDSQNQGGGLSSHITPVLIGTRYNYGSVSNNFKGLIDEVKVYQRALTADEVLQAYVPPVDTTPPTVPAVNQIASPVNATPQTLSGAKEAYSSIWINGSQAVAINSLTVWSCEVALSEGTNNFLITSKDAAGNESQPPVEVSIFLDITPPAQPTIDTLISPTNIDFQTITGTKSGDTTVIIVDCPTADEGDVTYPTGTTWSCQLTNLSEGNNDITVKAKDLVGNESLFASAIIILDTVAPAQPTIDSVVSPTNINSQAITGTKSEDTIAVTVTCPTATVEEVTYPTSTTWSCEIMNLSEGNNDIAVAAEDTAGNDSPTTSCTIVLDTIAPDQPTIDPVTSPTNVNYQTITGTRSEDTTAIEVTCSPPAIVGDVIYPTSTTWSCQLTNLSVGDNEITATAEDALGNPSSVASATITYQPQAGLTIDITSHENGDKVNTPTITVSGTVSDNAAQVKVNGIDATVIPAEAGIEGTFTAVGVSLTAGENPITATATKDALTDEDTINVIYDPSAPIIPAVIDDGKYTTPATQLHAYWIAADPESEITENQYSIGTAPGETDVVGWTTPAVPADTEVTYTGLSLSHGQTYYINVKSKNGAGIWSEVGSSDGIIVNAHVPVINSITPQDNSTFFTKTPVTITVDAWDSDGDPLEYRFLVDDDIVQDWSISPTYNWTALPTTKLIRKITCEVRDDKQGQTSQSVNYNVEIDTTDTTPPITLTVTADEYSNSLDSLHASWTAEDQETGIQEFQYAVGTTPGGTDVVDWTSAGTNTEMTHYGLSLTEGQAYYFNVRAINRVGLSNLSNPEGYNSPDNATEEVILKITSPQDNALITQNEFTIKGILQGANQVNINGKTINANPDGTFIGPTLVAPGYASRNNIQNDESHIIMNFPGSTTVTAIAGGQRQDIVVYYYQVFVKSEIDTENWFYLEDGTTKHGSGTYQTWNNDALTECPFSNWQEPDCKFRGRSTTEGEWAYYEPYLFSYSKASWREWNSGFSANGYMTTKMIIHTLPVIDGQNESLPLSLRNCSFDPRIQAFQFPLNLSSYEVNNQPLRLLSGNLLPKYFGAPSMNVCYIVLNDYEPNTDIELKVTTLPHYYHSDLGGWGFEFELLSIYGEIDLLRAELSSTKADNRTQQFIFGKTDIGSPCTDKDAKALIVFYKDVVDSEFNVLPFNVYLTLIPGVPSPYKMQWIKRKGPNAGILSNADKPQATFSNPTQGGLYEFDLAAGGKATKTHLLLPLAGADIIDWLDAETKLIGLWVDDIYSQTEENCADLNPALQEIKIFLTWFRLSIQFFDYKLDPVDSQEMAPCRKFNPPKGTYGFGTYGYVSGNNVVVYGSKINAMLWGLFGRYWGYSTDELKGGGNLAEILMRRRWDPPSSQHAIKLAGRIFDNPTADIRTILTEEELYQLQDSELNEEILWPCIYPADMAKSTLERPWLPTTPF